VIDSFLLLYSDVMGFYRVGGRSVPFHTLANTHSVTRLFFAIWFRARMRIRWIVRDELLFALVVFYLLGLVLLLPLVVGSDCIIFNCYIFVWFNWVRSMSPQFLL
jgi:hypothetical protein